MFLISILHQTTTTHLYTVRMTMLFLISILHQTTTPTRCTCGSARVVSYFNSTSNHNIQGQHRKPDVVVSYFNSTSNHNGNNWCNARGYVVSYFNSTSNHNSLKRRSTRRIVVSYFNSTSKITMPGNQLYTKLCNKYVANFTSLMRRENQQIQLMLILCYPVI